MRRQNISIGVIAAVALLTAPAARAGEVTLDGKTFRLPDGFVLEKVAGPPLVDRPIVAAFDQEGRLYVADSSGSNDPIKKQLEEKPHRIVRLEDTDGDGKFDKRTVFADKMMFPEGTLWRDGSLYVSAPPVIWKLTDTDDDGVADRREEWLDAKTLTGCANDLHGPYDGPDGWIYWCKGAFAEQTYERPGKSPLVTKASHIFRRRAEGGPVETVMTGGMDNPVDVTFTPGGERVFTTTFFQYPAGGKRDGLIHAIYGGVYGKVHAVLDNHVWTGPDVMPVLVHLGPAAPAGLTTFESDGFGPAYRNNLFACQFNLQRVSRHALKPDGGTFAPTNEDFLVSTHHDFHPTDTFEDADGSLIVVDTGGWYKLCCPTSIFHKPDVLGAIYRIRRAGAPKVDDPRGLKIDWAKQTPGQLATLLADPRLAVRKRAVEGLGKLGAASVPALRGVVEMGQSADARRLAVWASARIDDESAREVARKALPDGNEDVRQAALHAIGVRRDKAAVSALLPVLRSNSDQNRRAAAEALGRIGDPSAVPALLQALSARNDRALSHAFTYALYEIGDAKATAAGLASGSPETRKGALVALDQMGAKDLDAKVAAGLLASTSGEVRDAAAWVIGRHPEWAEVLTGQLAERLKSANLDAKAREELAGLLAKFAGSKPVAQLLGETVASDSAGESARRVALLAMSQATLKAAPTAWLESLAKASRKGDLLKEVVATARSLPAPASAPAAWTEALLQVADNPALGNDVRLDAYLTLPAAAIPATPTRLTYLLGLLGEDNPVALRTASADVLGRIKLEPAQVEQVIEAIREAGPLEVNRLLGAFDAASARTEPLGKKLVQALKGSNARGSLRVEALKPRFEKFPTPVRKDAEELYAVLDAENAKQRAKLESLLSSITAKSGDIRRGQAVFAGPKAACRTCHSIGYVGGKVGPDLSKIGGIRSERDLLEAIVLPSASFVRSYEPIVVSTKDGKVYAGILKNDAKDEVVLTINATEEARIPRAQIDEMKPGNVSVMPAGLDQQLTPENLADLIAFLKACK